MLVKNTPPDLLEKLGGLDADVVETAALAHDLGHPPFGHLTEDELNALAEEADLQDGFEGNAQSFRVITKLEVRETRAEMPGLDLTRASLNAILKYPWMRGKSKKHKEKWGAYESESREFAFARGGLGKGPAQSLEASVMDWADDIAYSVHDMEDFYRANRLPLDRLAQVEDEQVKFLDGVFKRKEMSDLKDRRKYETVAQSLFKMFPAEAYTGTREQKATLRILTSYEISKFQETTKITKDGLVVDDLIRTEVDLLKQLIWHYVIEDPTLAMQQHGQRRIIRELFQIYRAAFEAKKLNIFPPLVRSRLQGTKEEGLRTIIDLVASFTEQQTVQLHQRLTGRDNGRLFSALF